MKATVKADIRTGKVYSVPFPTLGAARRYVTGYQRPWRGVVIASHVVEAYEDGRLVSQERTP